MIWFLVDAAQVFPLTPLPKVDACAIPYVEDFAAFGCVLTELVCGLPFEGAHLVFFFAGLLVSNGEMAHGMASEIDRVDMAGGVFAGGLACAGFVWIGWLCCAAAWFGFIVGCCFDKVSVSGVEIEVIETRNGSKGIRHALGHSGA